MEINQLQEVVLHLPCIVLLLLSMVDIISSTDVKVPLVMDKTKWLLLQKPQLQHAGREFTTEDSQQHLLSVHQV